MTEKKKLLKVDKNGMITCYKFRPICVESKMRMSNNLNRIEQILDGNLFCADWRKLNDVLEGLYYFNESEPVFEVGGRLQNMKKSYNVCCLTSKLNNPLMWAFYASENTGVAIEVKLKYEEMKDVIYPVTYEKEIPYIELDSYLDEGSKLREISKFILTHKTNAWKHEKEIRILTHEENFKIEKPTTIYYGARMEKDKETYKEAYEELEKICDKHNVELISISEKFKKQFGKPIDFKEQKRI